MIPAADKCVPVMLDRQQAFDLFRRDISRWWPLATYSCSGDSLPTGSLDMQVGGTVIETTRDGSQHPRGQLLEWNPPQGFAMTWHPGQPPRQATRVEVSLAPLPSGGTEVRVRHCGREARGDRAAAARHSYDNGWPRVLERFVDTARRSQ
jgi:hypothetical protein